MDILAQNVVFGFRFDGLDEVRTDVGPHIGYVLVSFDFGAVDEEGQTFGRRYSHQYTHT